MSEIKLIIENIPTVLFYYLPGYVFLLTYHYCHGDISTSKPQLLNSVIVSVLGSAVVKTILPMVNSFVLLAITVATLSIVGIIVEKITSSSWFSNMFSLVFNRTPNEDFWKDVIDCDAGTIVHIFKNDKSIAGEFHTMQHSGDDRWIQLSSYKIMDNDGLILKEGCSDSEIVVKIAKDDMIELIYDMESQFLQK